MHKLRTLAVFGAGYVFGTKAGRERYQQLQQALTKVKEHPKVQETAHTVADKARDAAPMMKEKVTAAAHRSDSRAGSAGDDLNPDSLHFQDDPYPRGDLP